MRGKEPHETGAPTAGCQEDLQAELGSALTNNLPPPRTTVKQYLYEDTCLPETSQESSIMFANLPVHWQPWRARSSEELYLGEEELARLG